MMDVVAVARKVLPRSIKSRIAPSVKRVLAFYHRKDLNRLAALYETDKWGEHWYTQHYQRYLAPMRRSRIKLLEIGVGGYKDSNSGGESLRMWASFFRAGRIVGIDIEDKRHFAGGRIDIRQCDQTDAVGLTKLSEEYGGFNLVVDDGSHLNEHVIATFHVLFPLLCDGGIYAIEDVQTSYWPSWGGGPRAPQTTMEFFKGLADGLNHVEYPIEGYQPSYFDQCIVEIAFFHNLVVIRKGKYAEKSNVPHLVERELTDEIGCLPR
jgi:hypothetical protein